MLVYLAKLAQNICFNHHMDHAHHILQQRLNVDAARGETEPQLQLPEFTAEYVKLALPRHGIILDTSLVTHWYDHHEINGKTYEARRWEVSSQLEFFPPLTDFIQLQVEEATWYIKLLFAVNPNADVQVTISLTQVSVQPAELCGQITHTPLPGRLHIHSETAAAVTTIPDLKFLQEYLGQLSPLACAPDLKVPIEEVAKELLKDAKQNENQTSQY